MHKAFGSPAWRQEPGRGLQNMDSFVSAVLSRFFPEPEFFFNILYALTVVPAAQTPPTRHHVDVIAVEAAACTGNLKLPLS